MKPWLLIAATILLMAAVSFDCSTPSEVAGATDMPNETHAIVATVRDSLGDPVRGALVNVVSSEYLMPLPELVGKTQKNSARTVTDEAGVFEVDSLANGAYCIEVNDHTHAACLIRCVLNPGVAVKDLGVFSIKPYVVVIGTADTSGASGKMRYAQVYGIERIAPLRPNGAFVIDSLPADTLTIRIASPDSALMPVVFGAGAWTPGDTVFTPLVPWSFSKKIFMNTTSGGANVAGNVDGFPVLVRLTSANFDFTTAQPGGDDLRFAKPDGTRLPHEIEDWDTAARAAAVWVKVDTVFGNDFSHFIMMYWGNSNAASFSDAASVFDTADGNISVWHMDQTENGPVKDATDNHYDGVSYNVTPAPAAQGIIGVGQEFDGATSYVTFPGTANSKLNLPEQGTYTISAWANTATLDGNYHIIASKGDLQYNLEIMRTNDWEFAECRAVGGYTDVFSPAVVNTWHYVVGVRNGVKEYLYVDGACTDSVITVLDTTFVRSTGDDFTIGKKSNALDYFFWGKIDEVRVQNRPQSADWIRLCYMNQQAVDSLLVFK